MKKNRLFLPQNFKVCQWWWFDRILTFWCWLDIRYHYKKKKITDIRRAKTSSNIPLIYFITITDLLVVIKGQTQNQCSSTKSLQKWPPPPFLVKNKPRVILLISKWHLVFLSLAWSFRWVIVPSPMVHKY